MLHRSNGQLQWLEFELFANFPNLVHAVFLRHGGVSAHHCFSLNAHLRKTGDLQENISENQKRMLSVLNLKDLVVADAIHDTRIQLINHPQTAVSECDGLMTNQHSIAIMTTHADCQATIFYDPINHAVANVHAGWRGQAKNIYKETVSKMSQFFNSRPADLFVAVSPSLGPQNAEFQNYQKELPENFWQFQIKPTYFDLWAIARHQLEECGISSHHIQIAEIDTYAHPEDFFSYRRECKLTGRKDQVTGCHGTIAALR